MSLNTKQTSEDKTPQKETTGKARLQVLPEKSSLRAPSSFVATPVWPQPVEEDLPRALRGLAKIINGGLCHRCGSCVGICPTGVLGLDNEEYPSIVSLSSCTDCDLCVKVCPGDEFDYQESYREIFSTPGDLTDAHGEFSEAVLSYANDPEIREKSTSGGLVTAILMHLLESNQIDGAIVIANDETTIWKGKPIVARTREDLIRAMKSKYAISPTNAAFSEIRSLPGKYALVGLPCQIHGYTKAAALDARIRERIVLTVGLFCHAAVEHEAFRILWGSLGKEKDTANRFISRIGKHPGTPHIELADGSLSPVYFPKKTGFRPSSMEMINIIYRLYTPERCMTCFDASAEFADIAVGDPWMAPPDDDVDFERGWSYALIRTSRGKAAYQSLTDANAVTSKTLTRREALACNTIMFEEKRWRAFRVIETLRRQGKPIPSYGDHNFSLPRQSGKQFIKTELHMFSHLLCYLPRFRSPFLRLILSDFGYALLWLNNKRRTFRFWRRDTQALIRRKILGRS